jgi:hypothetical protein
MIYSTENDTRVGIERSGFAYTVQDSAFLRTLHPDIIRLSFGKPLRSTHLLV